MKRAAGIILLNKSNGHILMGKRSSKSPQPNTWATFGGKVGQGETCEQAARREFLEEAGVNYQDELHELDIEKEGDFMFVYYLGFVDAQFDVNINREHSAYCWHSLTDLYKGKFTPPANENHSLGKERLHPGLAKSIPKITPLILSILKK